MYKRSIINLKKTCRKGVVYGGATTRGVGLEQGGRSGTDIKERKLGVGGVRSSEAGGQAPSVVRGQRAGVDAYVGNADAKLDLGSSGKSPRGAILYFEALPAVYARPNGMVSFRESSGIDFVVSSLLQAGGYLTTGRFLSSNAFGSGIRVSMRGKNVFISTTSGTPVWLLREGAEPQALGKEPVELLADDLVVQGALTPRLGQHIETDIGNPAKYRLFRIEGTEGRLRVYQFQFAGNGQRASDPSWSIERYFAWRLGHSADYKLNPAYTSSLSNLKKVVTRLGLGDRQVKQIVNIVVAHALLGWEHRVTGDLNHITWKLEAYARAMEQVSWTPDEHARFQAGFVVTPRDLATAEHATFLSGFINLIEKSLAEHGRLGLMFPSLGLALNHLLKPAGFLREQAIALIFDLAKIDPSLVSIDSLHKLIYQLEVVAKSVVMEQDVQGSGESAALFSEVLGLPPERLSKVLIQLLQRSKITKSEDVEAEIDRIYQSLAQAFQVSMVLHKESNVETNRVIDSFLNETPLDYRRLEAYVLMGKVQRQDFLRTLKIGMKALPFIPGFAAVRAAFADNLFRDFLENGNRWP